MNTQHTPGPWHLQSTGIDGNTGYYKFTVDSPTHEIVADRVSVLGRTYPELEANAKLIAAAPELLEACRAALEDFTLLKAGVLTFDYVAGIIPQLKSAIAKATE